MAYKNVETNIAPLSVNVVQAAKIIGCGRSMVFELVKSGELRSFQLGTRRLISVDEIKRFIDARSKLTAPYKPTLESIRRSK